MELYRFHTQIDEWNYTDGIRRVTALGREWTPAPIQRSKWTFSGEGDSLEISMPLDTPPADQFAGLNPATGLRVTVYHRVGEAWVAWFRGPIHGGAAYEVKRGIARLRAVDLMAWGGQSPSDIYGPGCNYLLGDHRCGVDLQDYRLVIPVAAAARAGLSLTHASLAGEENGWWVGGYVACGPERSWIVGHQGETVELLSRFVRLPNSDFHVFPGCDGLKETCIEKFDNVARFSGCANIPERNPVTDGV